MDFGIRKTVQVPFEKALEKTKAVLAEEGFGVLTEIDMQAKLREKLGVETQRYVIFGACNPPLAHKAMQAEPEIGLLLPCNVIVYESRSGDTVVSAVDPDAMLSVVADSAAIREVARDAKLRLSRAIARL